MSHPTNNSLDGLLFSRASAIVYLLDRCVASRASAVAIDASVPCSGGTAIIKIVDNGSVILSSHVDQLINFALQPLINLGLLTGCLFLTQSEPETAVILFDPRLVEARLGYCTVLFDRHSEVGNPNAFSLRPGNNNLEAFEAITRLSPFKSIRALVDMLKSYSSVGTQTILYGVSPDFLQIQPTDLIFLNSSNNPRSPISFKQVLSVLYREPTVRLFLRGLEVNPRGLLQEIRSSHVKYVFDQFPGRPLTVDVGMVGPGDRPKGKSGEWFTPRDGPLLLFRAVYIYVDDKLSSIGDLPLGEQDMPNLIAVVAAPTLENVSVLTDMVLVSLEEFDWRFGAKTSINPPPPLSSPATSTATTPTIVRLSPEAIQSFRSQVFARSSDQTTPSKTPVQASDATPSTPVAAASSPASRKQKSATKAPTPKETRKKSKESKENGASEDQPPQQEIKPAKTKRSKKVLEQDEAYNCCQDWTNTGFQIQCDKCLMWQHGLCIGFVAHEDVPDPYYCDKCLLAMGVDFNGADDGGHCLKLRNARCWPDLRKICQYLLFYRSSFEDLSEFIFTTEQQWNEWLTGWETAMEKVRDLSQVIELLLDLETRLAAELKIAAWKTRREGWLRELRGIQAKSGKTQAKAKQSALLVELFNLVSEFPSFINDPGELARARAKARKRKQ